MGKFELYRWLNSGIEIFTTKKLTKILQNKAYQVTKFISLNERYNKEVISNMEITMVFQWAMVLST